MTVKLESLKAEIEAQYAPLQIDSVKLRRLPRLGKAERYRVKTLTDSISDGSDIDELDVIFDLIRVVADQPEKLISDIGDDIALAAKVLELWAETPVSA